MSVEPSIEDVVALQRELGIAAHLVYMGHSGFVLAHTGPERSSGESLGGCEVHRALYALDASPVAVGYYRATAADGRLELAALTDGESAP